MVFQVDHLKLGGVLDSVFRIYSDFMIASTSASFEFLNIKATNIEIDKETLEYTKQLTWSEFMIFMDGSIEYLSKSYQSFIINDCDDLDDEIMMVKSPPKYIHLWISSHSFKCLEDDLYNKWVDKIWKSHLTKVLLSISARQSSQLIKICLKLFKFNIVSIRFRLEYNNIASWVMLDLVRRSKTLKFLSMLIRKEQGDELHKFKNLTYDRKAKICKALMSKKICDSKKLKSLHYQNDSYVIQQNNLTGQEVYKLI